MCERDAARSADEQGVMALIHEVLLPSSSPAECAKLFPIQEGSSYHALKHNRSYESLAKERPEFPLMLSFIDVRRITSALCDLSTSPSAREGIVDGEFVRLIRTCMDLDKVDSQSRHSIAVCSRNLASSIHCRGG